MSIQEFENVFVTFLNLQAEAGKYCIHPPAFSARIPSSMGSAQERAMALRDQTMPYTRAPPLLLLRKSAVWRYYLLADGTRRLGRPLPLALSERLGLREGVLLHTRLLAAQGLLRVAIDLLCLAPQPYDSITRQYRRTEKLI